MVVVTWMLSTSRSLGCGDAADCGDVLAGGAGAGLGRGVCWQRARPASSRLKGR